MTMVCVANSGKLRGRVSGQSSARSHDNLIAMKFMLFIVLAMPEEFPTIQGGGSLILAWQIKNKRVLVVGGGEVACGLNTLYIDIAD